MGLSLAYELSGRGFSVCLLDRQELGREASWAGAGMIPPGPTIDTGQRLDRLALASQQLHPDWSQQLLEETGIDNGYRRCGGIHISFANKCPAGSLAAWCLQLSQLGIRHQQLSSQDLAEVEPELSRKAVDGEEAVLLCDEAQIRSPRHVRALIAACEQRGVRLVPHAQVRSFRTQQDRILAAETDTEHIVADNFFIAAGCWSQQLTDQLAVSVPVTPIRGQMLLLTADAGILRHVIVDGARYLVPRFDGRVLVGSTEEQVGFNKETTDTAINDLFRFAVGVVPRLREAEQQGRWSGLRPQPASGTPISERLPRWSNAWLVTGHYRAGLQLSPATAVALADELEGLGDCDAGQPAGVRRQASHGAPPLRARSDV